ncbi:MAG: efflux transporter outer membrane subunit [Leeuwenhoekiella sp.]
MKRYIIVLFILLSSCTPKMQYVEPPVTMPEEFRQSGSDIIPQKWWTAFDDKQLNTLIDSALAKNLDLAATWQQFKVATAIRRQQKSFLWPDIEAGSQNAFSRPEPDFAGGENVQLGLSASYEVDLWGRIRTAAQAADLRMRASYQDYQAAAISLSATIAQTYFQLITANKQLQLAEIQMQTNEDLLKLIRARFTGGQVGSVDVFRQRQLVEETRNQRLAYKGDVQVLNNQLAVLLGKSPQQLNEVTPDSLPTIPELPVTGLPLELVRRRPDVVRSFNLVLAADRDMAEAIRNKYPRIFINLSAQARSNNYANLFNEWAYTLAGNLVAPLLYGGRLRAEVDRTEALKNQQLYNYGQTVLNAFREVEDALIQEENQIQRLETLQLQLKLAESTNRQLRLGFLYGTSNYLDVFLALDREQQLRRDYIDAQQRQLEIRINMYRALAGSFDASGENELEDISQ